MIFWFRRCIEARNHGIAVERQLLDALHLVGHVDTRDLEQCGEDVDYMMETLAQAASVVDTVGP